MYLNAYSCFSFKYGVLSPEKILALAQSKGITSVALTDINNTSGCVDFMRLASAYQVKPLLGIDFRNEDTQLYIGIAMNNEGFAELNRFLSDCLSSGKDIPERPPRFQHAFVIYPFGKIKAAELYENEYIGVRPSDTGLYLLAESKEGMRYKYLMLGTLSFRDKMDFNTHRLLRAIGKNTLLSKLPLSSQASMFDMVCSEDELLQKYQSIPWLIENTRRLIAQCEIHMEFGVNKNKKIFTASEQEDRVLLTQLCREGLSYRYPQINEEIEQRLDKELQMIFKMGFCSYFLINSDVVRYARSKQFFYVGRGSGANSLAAYCLRITDVDPIELDLYFERFINPHRVNPPDFDIDFSWKDRDEIIAYFFKKYGKEHTALIGTYNTFQSNAIIRELGKVFGLPKSEIDALSNHKKEEPSDHISKLIRLYGERIRDLPNHLGIHAGGIIISEKPVYHYTATSFPPKNFPVTQFSMLEAEDLGLYKFDILSQRGLGHIRDTVSIVKENKGVDIDVHQIHRFKQDALIKKHLRQGKTIGCFYVESPAMRMLLTKLEADTYKVLVAASSIIRPGVSQSGMMKEYIMRYKDPSRRKHIHPLLGSLMEETFGVMVYQEDVIKVAHFFAGLTLAEADMLRRGMSGKFRGRDEFAKIREKFFLSCKEKGHTEAISNEVWRQIESFAGYSFSKGHSASYAVESYQSLFLKAYFPLEFMVGVINNFGGFYSTEFYIHEARMQGAEIRPPCVNHSEYYTCIKGKVIYLGFVHVLGLEEKISKEIVAEHKRGGAFASLEDFCNRLRISNEQIRILIRLGAFVFTNVSKKELLWELLAIMGKNKKTKVFADLFEHPPKVYTLPVLQYRSYEDALDEIELLGFSLSSPFLLLQNYPVDTVKAQNLKSKMQQQVGISGYLVCVKYTRTAKGDTMAFATFVDQEGHFFDTTHFPVVFKKYPFRGKGCYQIRGIVDEEFGFFSIQVRMMVKLPVISFE